MNATALKPNIPRRVFPNAIRAFEGRRLCGPRCERIPNHVAFACSFTVEKQEGDESVTRAGCLRPEKTICQTRGRPRLVD